MNPRRHPLIDLRDHGLSDVARIFEALGEPGISVLHEAADRRRARGPAHPGRGGGVHGTTQAGTERAIAREGNRVKRSTPRPSTR